MQYHWGSLKNRQASGAHHALGVLFCLVFFFLSFFLEVMLGNTNSYHISSSSSSPWKRRKQSTDQHDQVRCVYNVIVFIIFDYSIV